MQFIEVNFEEPNFTCACNAANTNGQVQLLILADKTLTVMSPINGVVATHSLEVPTVATAAWVSDKKRLAREFARPSNLLVLDEPTNDLDLETLDLLQEVIGDYDGTVLIVSHDRDFLDRTVTITLGLDGSGHVDVVAGGYEDWERQRSQRVDTKRAPAAKASSAAPAPPPAPRAKLTYKDQRDYDQLPKRIEEMEKTIARNEALLADPDLYTRDFARFEALTKAIERERTEKEAAEMRWLELAEQVEALG